MENESTSINDIVQKAAEKIKEDQNSTGDQNNNTNNNSGGEDEAAKAAAAQKVIDDAAAAKAAEEEKAKDLTPDPLAELYKEFGVDSKEALKEKLKATEAKKELSPEEKEKELQVYQANVLKHATETGVMKIEDFHKLENLKSKPDADLVFDAWVEEWKEENEETVSEDEDWQKQAKEDFEKQYKLKSENEAAKKRGESKLAKEAAEIRKPLTESYEKAKAEFDQEQDLRNTVPEYNKAVKAAINESIPDKYSAYKGKDGEADVEIDIDLTPEDKKEIAENIEAKFSKNLDAFGKFKSGNAAEIKTIAKQETDRFIEDKYREEAKQKIAEKFLSIGIGKGEIGAKNSFALKQGSQAADNQLAVDAKQQVLESMRSKAG